MGLPIFQVDAFTDKPFAGNPAAVCILTEPRDAGWLQSVAQEMNLAETAFLLRQGDVFNLRWFTPTIEVDLCGHATLASAHVLWEAGYVKPDQLARFSTRSGLLTCERKGSWIEMDFPAEPADNTTSPPGLEKALGVTASYVGKNRFDYLVEVDSEETVRKLKPNFGLLGEIPTRGFIVTSRASSPGYDFVSRFFAPRAGIPEDPVTGSSHCCLGTFWKTRFNKDEFVAFQASPRGGVIRVRVAGSRVILGGQAVTVLRGELTSPMLQAGTGVCSGRLPGPMARHPHPSEPIPVPEPRNPHWTMQGFEHMCGRPEVGVGEPRMEEWMVRVQSVVTKVMPVALEPAYVAKAKPAMESAMKAASQGRCGQKCKTGDQRERKRREYAFHFLSPSREACLRLASKRFMGKATEHFERASI